MKEPKVSPKLKKICLLIVPPLVFLLKDLIATVVLLASEPGITAGQTLFYAITLLPGTLFLSTGHAILFNVFFGALLGLVLYLRAMRQRDGVPN